MQTFRKYLYSKSFCTKLPVYSYDSLLARRKNIIEASLKGCSASRDRTGHQTMHFRKLITIPFDPESTHRHRIYKFTYGFGFKFTTRSNDDVHEYARHTLNLVGYSCDCVPCERCDFKINKLHICRESEEA